MLKQCDIVFFDSNAIAAAHDVRAWNALRKRFRLVTVGTCAEEVTRRNRHGQTLIGKDLEDFKSELEVRQVGDVARFELLEVLGVRVALDPGERDLLAVVRLETTANWHICGPDRATLRALKVLNMLDRMVSLEELCAKVGVSAVGLRQEMTKTWLSGKRTRLELGDTLI